jgi:Protein of unknown function (DUF3431)
MEKVKIVVARYKEDVSWTNSMSPCIIYNKSDSTPESTHPVISLPNVGREGHTYLHHIITHYDHLDDYTIFLQGNPFDHSPHLAQKLQSIYTLLFIKNKSISFDYLSEKIIPCNLNNCEYDTHLSPQLISNYRHLFGISKNEHSFVFGAGAQFIVSKQTILSRPKSFYQKIIKLLDYDTNPIEGFVIERFWNMIFTHSE